MMMQQVEKSASQRVKDNLANLQAVHCSATVLHFQGRVLTKVSSFMFLGPIFLKNCIVENCHPNLQMKAPQLFQVSSFEFLQLLQAAKMSLYKGTR
jgi:hypothetical protein